MITIGVGSSLGGSSGKKTILMNLLIELTRLEPKFRCFVIDLNLDDPSLTFALENNTEKPTYFSQDLFENFEIQTLIDGALSLHNEQNTQNFVKILPSSGNLAKGSLNLSKLALRIEEFRKSNSIDFLILLLPRLSINSAYLSYLTLIDMLILIVAARKENIRNTHQLIHKEIIYYPLPIGIILNMVDEVFLTPKDMEDYIKTMEKNLDAPIIATIPFSDELRKVTKNGIVTKSLPPDLETMFRQLSLHFKSWVDSVLLPFNFEHEDRGYKQHEKEKLIALFVADKISGIPLFSYYFSAESARHYKNPSLLMGALAGITAVIQESIGTEKAGMLQKIHHTNVIILFKVGTYTTTVLYTKKESDKIHQLLNEFSAHFEKELHDEILLFKKTGNVTQFEKKATELTEKVFADFIFYVPAQSPIISRLLTKIAQEKSLTNVESIWNYFLENEFDSTNETLMYELFKEFFSEHNRIHELIKNHLHFSREIRHKIQRFALKQQKQSCWCIKSPTYILAKSVDAIHFIDLPKHLQPTLKAFLEFDLLTAEEIAQTTKRSETEEIAYLTELEKLGFVKRIYRRNE